MTRGQLGWVFDVVARSERARAALNPYVDATEMRALKQMQRRRRDMVLDAVFSESEEARRRES